MEKGKEQKRKREKGKEYDEAIVSPRNRRNRPKERQGSTSEGD